MNAAINSFEYATTGHPAQRTCVAIIWAREATSEEQRERLSQDLQGHSGVQSALFSLHRPALMVVRFNPQETKGSELVATINRHGANARLVGC